MTKKDPNEIDIQKPYDTNVTTGKMTFYIWLFSGITIFLIGIFLTISDSISVGVTSANEIGEGRGRLTFITGPGALVLGLIILIPLYFNRKNKIIR